MYFLVICIVRLTQLKPLKMLTIALLPGNDETNRIRYSPLVSSLDYRGTPHNNNSYENMLIGNVNVLC